MYWNNHLSKRRMHIRMININMRCIEMYTAMTGQPAFNMININMRCIEMRQEARIAILYRRLTLTWDVLKYLSHTRTTNDSPTININMRCIEITWIWQRKGTCRQININMRCIEIEKYKFFLDAPFGLTLTWDVLKWR